MTTDKGAPPVVGCACEMTEDDYDRGGEDWIFLGRTFDATNCKRHGV